MKDGRSIAVGFLYKMAMAASVRDLRRQGLLERDEGILAYAWEQPDLSPAVAAMPMALAYTRYGVNRMSWNLTDRALVLIPFSAMVRDRVRHETPEAYRVPYGMEFMIDVVPLPSIDTLLLNVRDDEGPDGVLYRGRFRPVRMLYETGFVDLLNALAMQNQLAVRHVRINERFEGA
ncbi:hypothetical protein AB0B66_11915 [Catellatospora sp. NPDC049111]|uniref:hypothetical protein n=1 Tax=Catellatospora sp. NPDC049111 TaxID=3155271 RepID=UPI003408DDB0